MPSVPVTHPYHLHHTKPTNIEVGSVTIPYCTQRKAWALHGGEFQTNPRLVYLYAENLNKKMVLQQSKPKLIRKYYVS